MIRRGLILILSMLACAAAPKDDPAAKDAGMLRRADAFLAAVRAGNAEGVKALLTTDARRKLEATPNVDLVAMTTSIVGTGAHSIELARHIAVPAPTLAVSSPVPFTLSLPPATGESYVLLLSFPRDASTAALELVYAKEGTDWRLQFVDGGLLAAGGKRADAWFSDAKALGTTGAVIAESVRLAAAMQCLRPVAGLKYDFENEFTSYTRALIERVEARIRFPAALPGATKPTVYRIDATFDGPQLLPLVHATTTIPLEETAALERESARAEPDLMTLLPGLCTGVSRYAVQWYARAPLNPSVDYRRQTVVRPCPVEASP